MWSIKSKPKHEIYTYGIIAERLMQKCGKNADAIKIRKIIFRATDVPAKLTYITYVKFHTEWSNSASKTKSKYYVGHDIMAYFISFNELFSCS